jgi:hypothetical protein
VVRSASIKVGSAFISGVSVYWIHRTDPAEMDADLQ